MKRSEKNSPLSQVKTELKARKRRKKRTCCGKIMRKVKHHSAEVGRITGKGFDYICDVCTPPQYGDQL